MSDDESVRLARWLKSQLARGVDRDRALTEMRARSTDAHAAIFALREAAGLSKSGAAQVLLAHPAWRETIERLHRDTVAFFDGESDGPADRH